MRHVKAAVAAAAITAAIFCSSAGAAGPTSGTFLYLVGYPGAVEQAFTPDDSLISGGYGNIFEGWVFPNAGGPCCAGGSWHVMLSAAAGHQLVPGTYDDAVGFGEDPTHPWLSVFQSYGGFSSCTGGSFVVRDIATGSSGSVVSLDVTFHQSCYFGPASGRFRIGMGLVAPDTAPPTLRIPGDVTAEAADGSPRASVAFDVSALDDVDPGAAASCDPSSGSAFGVSTTTVTCTATDASGNRSTGTFRVTVLPALELAVIVDRGSVDPRTGVTTVIGHVRCGHSAPVDIYGDLSQLVAHRALLGASFDTSVDCSPPWTTWQAQTSADNGRFSPGKAQVHVSAYSCEFDCHSVDVTAGTRLTAAKP